METEFSHTLAAGRAGLPAALDALEAWLNGLGLAPSVTGPVMVAADDILSNVLDHGGAQSVGITARAVAGLVTVEVVDDGEAFDPLAVEAPDTTLALEARDVGGLGVHLVRRLMDEVRYERRDGRNRLRFSKTFDAP
ncbi:ATP-binding protein [Phenylobacterium kunshanense]|uniref:ATP-binding protein n=1 Tax=Phenylobacterium kunshanense TaxID=1445034 RepID=A0A328BBB4_9CAUL|nr:ATP-binding protein [Phenylobacterium kunshanense]RAK63034.1 ATP-binding protein [Phenylobacterium kunshanense]